MIKSILISSLLLNLGLLLGRFSGFAREAIVATVYGTGHEADIVVLILTAPDLLINILVGGAMGAVLIPEFSKNSENAKKILFQAMLLAGCVFVVIAMILNWQSGILATILAPGFSSAKIAQLAVNLEIVVWLLPLTALAGMASAYLHFRGKFFIASLGTLIINTAIIGGLLLIYFSHKPMFWIGIFVLLGGSFRLFSQLFLIKIKFNFLHYFDKILLNKDILLRYFQALLSGSSLLFIPILARVFASYAGEGSVAIMNYSTKLVEFPLLIAITFFIVVLFPKLADSFINDKKVYKKITHYGAQSIMAVSVLITIALILLSGHYVDIIFNHGNMSAEGLAKIQTLIEIGLLVLPLQGGTLFFTAVFHSQKNTKTPLIVNSAALLMFVLLYLGGVFDSDISMIMWGMVASYALAFGLQILLLKVDNIKLFWVFFKIEFVAGLLLSSVVLYLFSAWIGSAQFASIITLLLSAVIGIIALITLALFNQEFRLLIKNNL